MFSWNRSQNTPSDSKAISPSSSATALAEPPVEPAAPEPSGPPPARRLTDAPCATRLGGLRIRGTLTGSDSVELSGTFDGPINVEALCRVNAGGHVTGDITAGDAVIAGDVQGRLTVIGRLELGAHARVVADIEAGTIAIAEGCFIEGRIHMRGSTTGSQPVTFKEKRRGKRRKGHGSHAVAPSVAGAPTMPDAPPAAEASGPSAIAPSEPAGLPAVAPHLPQPEEPSAT